MILSGILREGVKMKVKVGNKVYDGEKEPIMIIMSEDEKKQITEMPEGVQRYCIYPDTEEWTKENHTNIVNLMN